MSGIEEIIKKQQELLRLQKELETEKMKAEAAIHEEQGKVIGQMKNLAARLEELNSNLKHLDRPQNEAVLPLLEALKRLPASRPRTAARPASKAAVPRPEPVVEKPVTQAPAARKRSSESKSKSDKKSPPASGSSLTGKEPALTESKKSSASPTKPEKEALPPIIMALLESADTSEPEDEEARPQEDGKESGDLPSGCKLFLIARGRLQINYRGGAVVVSNPSIDAGSDLGDFLKEQGMSVADRQRVGNKAAEMLVKKVKT